MTRLTALLAIVFAGVAAVAWADAGETRFPLSQSIHAAGGGLVYIAARCPRSAVDDCQGYVRLAQPTGEFTTGRAYTPRALFHLPAGKRDRLAVRLTERAMRLLQRRGRLPARALVYRSRRHVTPTLGGHVDVLAPCPGATEFTSGC